MASYTPSAAESTMAELLKAMSNNVLVINTERSSKYFALELQVSESSKNKNAIVINPARVSFMVNDWKFKEKADAIRIDAKKYEPHKVLRFPNLSPEKITKNRIFFREIVEEAMNASRSRQERTDG